MKTKILLSFFLFLIAFTGFSAQWTINNVGFTFSPSSVTISNGDSVNFSLESAHNALEVSEATWNANGNTPLTGGFETPFGGGLVLPSNLTVGTHYYVCQPHASLGMKGIIIVEPSNGIADLKLEGNFSVYPNPTSGLFTLSDPNYISGSEYRIIDLSGKQIGRGFVNTNATQVDISRFPPGVYLIELLGKRSQVIRVIKY
jgi:plastocyanin